MKSTDLDIHKKFTGS